tara:strand:+ start:798 stop:1526 length:729 start_codon:yes stop_codon:yes gene_type:complete
MALDYTSIEELINDFQLMIDDTSYDKEAHIYQLRLTALQGLRELSFDVGQEVYTVERTVSTSTLNITLPDDFVKLLRVGYKGSDGEFHALGINPNLSLDAEVVAQVGDNSYNENNPYYHVDLGKKFGIGGGNNSLGYYRLNKKDNTINFSSGLAGKKLFIEYLSDPVSQKAPRVHKFCEEALRCYIYYKYIQRKRGIPANEKQMAKRAFYNEKRLARARMMSFSKETALQTSRKAFKQSPKL